MSSAKIEIFFANTARNPDNNDYLCIMRFFDGYVHEKHQHRINPTLLWEYDYDKMDWIASKKLVAERVIQMGRMSDWYAAFDLYGGIKGFREIAKNEVDDLDDRTLDFLCLAFNLKKEETKCYKSKQSRLRHLTS